MYVGNRLATTRANPEGLRVVAVCSVETCDRQERGQSGFCGAHYQRVQKYGDPRPSDPIRTPLPSECLAPDCAKIPHARGLCSKHYARIREYGQLDLPARPAAEPARWVTRFGYRVVYLPGHPMSNSSGAVTEHRLGMAESIGRHLLAHESVHHVNGDRLDNRIENLELWSKSQPAGQRVADKVRWAKEILGLYEPESLST